MFAHYARLVNRTANRLRLLALVEFFGAGWELHERDLFGFAGLMLAGFVFAWLSWGPRY